MGTDTIVLPCGKTATLAAAPTLTPPDDQSPKPVPIENRRVVAFFIGGAGDNESYYFAGPYQNISHARAPFDRRIDLAGKKQFYKSHSLSYSDARGSSDIKKHVISKIPDKASPVYIVGHSLGGWNGAHLSSILTEQGYQVEMLITLDPVGKGALVWLGSDIYYKQPEPKSKFWINVRATPKQPNASDSVADFGEHWEITSGPDINHRMNTNHANAWDMFLEPIQDTVSAADYMFESAISYIGR